MAQSGAWGPGAFDPGDAGCMLSATILAGPIPSQAENHAVPPDFCPWCPVFMDMKARGPTLGRLLGDLRARNGWTLKEMSERTGIPVSTLSKVEHDRLTLTYDKLLQVSEGLNISLSELFGDLTNGVGTDTAVTARRSIGLMTDAVRVNTKNYDYYYMCPELRQK